jgi:hypothetical protein
MVITTHHLLLSVMVRCLITAAEAAAQVETAVELVMVVAVQPGQTGLDNLLLEAVLGRQAIHLLQILVCTEMAVMVAECLPLTEAAALES